jgi:D-glycero-alpha-D-manno-heptose-7-phosphate kinase
MIISRTPYRISFFGGGTDYPAWYHEHGGAVLATTIDKYCFLSCRYLPPFFEHRTRLVYSKIELCRNNSEIAHPAVRHVLRFLKVERGVEIQCHADLPARSGLGSSSAFVVGLLNALYALRGRKTDREQLAAEAIHVEQGLLRETVGSQDQVLAAHGGLQHVEFQTSGKISVRPLILPTDRINELNDHLMLFYTGIIRTASDVAKSYVSNIQDKQQQLHMIRGLVDDSIGILRSRDNIDKFGQLLDKAWQAKRSLSQEVSNQSVDRLYTAARSAGALGGKLIGAGGGGFLLLFVPPDRQMHVRKALSQLIHVPFCFETSGSRIVFADASEDFSAVEQQRLNQEIMEFRELDSLRAA